MVNGIEKSIPVVTCVPSGWHALLILNNAFQDAMIEVPFLKVRFFSFDSRENEVNYSL